VKHPNPGRPNAPELSATAERTSRVSGLVQSPQESSFPSAGISPPRNTSAQIQQSAHVFNQGPDAIAQLAELKKASSYQRSDMIAKGGWATMPGGTDPVRGAANICVEKLMNAALKTAAATN
jgi:hypothetical protein